MYTSKPSQTIKTLARIRNNMAGLRVYNGGTEPVELIHDGKAYLFVPDGLWMAPGDDEPKQYDGITEIKDVYGVDSEELVNRRKEHGNRAEALKVLQPNKLISAAVNIAERAERKLGARGVIVLTGDPAIDDPLKKQAKAAWVKFHTERAEKTIVRYRERTQAFYADPRNNGHIPPAMTEFETSEQEFLDEVRAGKLEGRKYVCKYKCGYQTDDAAKMTRHVKVSHPAAQDDARTEQMLRDGAEQESEQEQPTERRGRRKATAA